MSIADFLYSSAVANIWANPHVDDQVTFRMVRLTGRTGARNCLSLPYTNIGLPNNVDKFHVFELGDVNLHRLGIDNGLPGWTELQTLIDREQIVINVFSSGRMVRLNTVYLKQLTNGNVIIGVKLDGNRDTLIYGTDTFIRFYSNVVNSVGANNAANTVSVNSIEVIDLASVISFMNEISNVAVVMGATPQVYLDGLLLPDGILNHNTIPVGSILGYIADPNIIAHHKLDLGSLNGYYSELDSSNKLVLSLDSTEYIYLDDLDIYISGIKPSTSRRLGVYYPRLHKYMLRTLSDMDWGIDAGTLHARLEDLNDFIEEDLTDIQVHVYRRKTPARKERVLDSNRISDLLNLPFDLRKQAISGSGATLDLWHASSLEQCPYNTWIGATQWEIGYELLQGVYSRQAAIITLESVYKKYGASSWSLPPIASNGGGELLMYDVQGRNPTTVVYNDTPHGNEDYAGGVGYEVFYPDYHASLPLDVIVPAGDESDSVIENGFDILCYYSVNGTLRLANIDDEYSILDDDANGITYIKWDSKIHKYNRWVRSAQRRVQWNRTINIAEYTQGIDIYNGRALSNDIGMRDLMVWVNGALMVEGLDFIVLAGKIYLCSMNAFTGANIAVRVIYSGLSKTLKHLPNNTWGWVKHGSITQDNRVDLYVNRNKLLFVGGAAVPLTQVYVGELLDNTPTTLVHPDGSPYNLINKPQWSRSTELDLSVPSEVTDSNVDQSVSDYITKVMKITPSTELVVLGSKYDLVSVFMNNIIDALVAGDIVIGNETISYTRIQFLVAPYAHLLDVDPTQQAHDLDYVNIHPRWSSTPVPVSAAAFNFITLVNETVLGGQVYGLNLYLTIT